VGAARYLLDTCVLSELVKNTPEPRVLQWFEARRAHELCTSAMTLAELQRCVTRLPESRRRTELAQWLQQLDAGFEDRMLAFDKQVALVWATMMVEAEAQGKPMAAFDSIIAATARAHTCVLVTRNVHDFAQAGIEILNPWGVSVGQRCERRSAHTKKP
jgi:predicted nucleic acid-binding protein